MSMRILLADDHKLFASGVRNLLEAGGFTVVGSVASGAEAVEAARRLNPDLILMDINMAGMDGLAATRLIKAEFPSIMIVMLTVESDDKAVFEAIRNGASGFLLKNLEAAELFNCLEQLSRGEAVFSPEVAELMLREYGTVKPLQDIPQNSIARLTTRQEEILRQVASGLTYKQIGSVLSITEATVKYHMNEILERLHLDNRAQAIAYITKADERLLQQ